MAKYKITEFQDVNLEFREKNSKLWDIKLGTAIKKVLKKKSNVRYKVMVKTGSHGKNKSN